MEKLVLTAQNRDVSANTPASVRKQGDIPAVLYGHNIATSHLTIKRSEFEKLFRKSGENTIVELKSDDGKVKNVLVHDVQKHYLTGLPIHVDFYEVSMTEKLQTEVPLEFVGESQAVKNMGGTLVKVLDSVEVECLPADLPHVIEVDISVLKTFDDFIQVKDLPVPARVEILTALDDVIVNVQPPRDIEAELAQPVVEDISKVEGASEDKPEEVAETPAKK
jgi:large subunit ribosomal protein L25